MPQPPKGPRDESSHRSAISTKHAPVPPRTAEPSEADEGFEEELDLDVSAQPHDRASERFKVIDNGEPQPGEELEYFEDEPISEADIAAAGVFADDDDEDEDEAPASESVDGDEGEARKERRPDHIGNGRSGGVAERLQKILARVGFGSRRKCEELILDGRVAVNGVIAAQLGAKAVLGRDKITVDGERVRPPRAIYYIVNKPKGWYCTEDAPDKMLLDLIPGEHPRIFTVGRLDKMCEGLMLATNDGRVANILTHPRYRVPKVYKIVVKGHIKFEEVAQIEKALFYAINAGSFERIKVLKRSPTASGLRLIVYEGLPASFRDICLRYGHPINSITRIKVGPLDMEGLGPGQARKLRTQEIDALSAFATEAEGGKLKPNEHRLVTAAWIKQASARAEAQDPPKFDSKERGNRASAPVGGQKHVRETMSREAGGRGNSAAQAQRRSAGFGGSREPGGSAGGPRGPGGGPRTGGPGGAPYRGNGSRGPGGGGQNRGAGPISGPRSGPRGDDAPRGDRPRSGSGPRSGGGQGGGNFSQRG